MGFMDNFIKWNIVAPVVGIQYLIRENENVVGEMASHAIQRPLVHFHYSGVIMGTTASQITSLMNVYSNKSRDQRKNQSSAPLAFVRGIHLSPVYSPHKRLVMRKMFPFDDVIMQNESTKCFEIAMCILRYLLSEEFRKGASWLARKGQSWGVYCGIIVWSELGFLICV